MGDILRNVYKLRDNFYYHGPITEESEICAEQKIEDVEVVCKVKRFLAGGEAKLKEVYSRIEKLEADAKTRGREIYVQFPPIGDPDYRFCVVVEGVRPYDKREITREETESSPLESAIESDALVPASV